MAKKNRPGCPCCCPAPDPVCVHVVGCPVPARWLIPPRAALPLPGAAVSLDDGHGHSYSGTTDASGNVCWAGVPQGYYTLVTSKARFVTDTRTVRVACTGALAVALGPSPGYVCCPNCPDPLPETLYASVPGVGTLTLTWDGSGAWAAPPTTVTSSAVVSAVAGTFLGFPAVRCACPLVSGSVTLTLAFNCDRRLIVHAPGSQPSCPPGYGYPATVQGYKPDSGCDTGITNDAVQVAETDGSGLTPTPNDCSVPLAVSYTVPPDWDYLHSGTGRIDRGAVPGLFSGTVTITE